MKSPPKRQPPVRIPIPLERFVEGVLQIDPKKLARKKAAKKKVSRPARAAKKKGG